MTIFSDENNHSFKKHDHHDDGLKIEVRIITNGFCKVTISYKTYSKKSFSVDECLRF